MSEIRLEVEIDGIKYPLVTKESKENVEKIAAYVDKKIKDVKSDKLTFDKELMTACLNIADDYLKVSSKHESYKEETREAVENYPGLQEDYESYKKDYGPYKEKYEDLKDEVKDLRDLLKKRDEEILDLKRDENDAQSLREKMKDLYKEVMDLTKENEMLKGKI